MVFWKKKPRSDQQSTDTDELKSSSDQKVRNRFKEAHRRLKNHKYFEQGASPTAPYGFLDGRPLIGESTPINGGIYVSTIPCCEALVIDRRHGRLDEVYTELMVAFALDNGSNQQLEGKIFPYIIQMVQDRLFFSPQSVNDLLKRKGIMPDKKVSLDLFLSRGIGVARHQVMLAAYLIERLKERGYLAGKLSLSSEFNFADQTPERLIYTSPTGDVFEFDPTSLRRSQGRATGAHQMQGLYQKVA